jgi:class 3 adenylate cyclase
MPASGRPAIFPESRDPKYRKWADAFIQARLKVGLLLATTSLVTFIALNLSRYPAIGHTWLAINLSQFAVLVICAAILFSRFAGSTLALTFLLLSSSLTLAPLLWYLTLEHTLKVDIFTWTLVFLAQATLIPLRWQLHLTSQLIIIVAVIVIALTIPSEYRVDTPNDDHLFLALYFLWFCVIATTAVFLHERLQYAEFSGRHFLQIERQRSEKLLRNILPDVIAQRLHSGEATIADHHAETSVLFADIVDFTELANRLPPDTLVGLLNELFSNFDRMLDDYNVEKVKTIGDAYMAVAGVPTANPSHLTDLADFALAMQHTVEQFNHKHRYALQLRIGIHTGPVVAGVIGERKFSYDLWGETVNTASRMETSGIPGEIQVSTEVYNDLKEHYHFTQRGQVEIKGIGTMTTWLLKSKVSNQVGNPKLNTDN